MHCALLSNPDSTFAGSVIPKGEVIVIIIVVVIIINDELFIGIQMMFFLFISKSTLESFCLLYQLKIL